MLARWVGAGGVPPIVRANATPPKAAHYAFCLADEPVKGRQPAYSGAKMGALDTRCVYQRVADVDRIMTVEPDLMPMLVQGRRQPHGKNLDATNPRVPNDYCSSHGSKRVAREVLRG